MSDDRERAGVYVGGPVAAKGNVTIGQNIATGDGAKVIGSTPPPDGTGTERDAGRVGIRLGFVVDVAGYGPRPMPDRGDVQRRLHALVQEVLLDLGIDPSSADREGTGDGMIVLLPEGGQFQRLLPLLLQTMTLRLAADNRRHTDRIRLRMATSIGPVGHGAAGYTEDTVTEMSRLVDSDAPRHALERHPTIDLAVVVSKVLHGWVVAAGHPGLDAADFQPVSVRVKTFHATAWLWIPRA